MNDSDVLNGDINAQLAKKLSVALQAAELGVWEWDLAADRFTYSARAKEIFGFAPDVEVTRERILEVMHPEDHLRAKEQAAQSMDPEKQSAPPLSLSHKARRHWRGAVDTRVRRTHFQGNGRHPCCGRLHRHGPGRDCRGGGEGAPGVPRSAAATGDRSERYGSVGDRSSHGDGNAFARIE